MAPKRVYTAVVTETKGQTTSTRLAAKPESKKELRAKFQAELANMKETKALLKAAKQEAPQFFRRKNMPTAERLKCTLTPSGESRMVKHRAERRLGRHQKHGLRSVCD